MTKIRHSGNKRRFLKYAALGIILPCMILISCSKKEEEEKSISYADQLYERAIKLAKLYRDSIARATDSTSVKELFSNFNLKHTELVFSYPADTELSLSEAQNDTIFEQFIALRQFYNQKLENLAHKAVTDTIPEENE